MVELARMTDVRGLNPRITPDELQQRFGDDYERFSLIVVAEAALPKVPLGIVTWLSQSANSGDWVECLLHNEGIHQISWWARRATLGTEADATQRALATLQAIRLRIPEARIIARPHIMPPSRKPAESRALDRLKQAHLAEHEREVERLREKHRLPAFHPTTPEIDRLLAMGDSAFRDVVARDVQNKKQVTSLAHRAVTSRWHDALVELGVLTFDALGFPIPKLDDTGDAMRLAVLDEWLPEGPLDRAEIATWTARLTFLTHVRICLTERARLRRTMNREVTEKVFRPVEDHLRQTYFAEYARYRIEEGSAALSA